MSIHDYLDLMDNDSEIGAVANIDQDTHVLK